MISSLFRFVFRRRAEQRSLFVDAPIAVIGDLHGCVDLLEIMLARLAQEAPEAQLVFVGDYIDRGPSSAAVLERVIELNDAICLMGNHEHMMLKFISDPEGAGTRWLRHGGYETLASFGISIGQSREMRNALVDALGAETLAWLRSRPCMFKTGSLYVTHAGADPAEPIEMQDATTLIWGHPNFGRVRRKDGFWIAHGHTIVSSAIEHRGCISVDTGAFATGRLSAALFVGDKLSFLDVSDP